MVNFSGVKTEILSDIGRQSIVLAGSARPHVDPDLQPLLELACDRYWILDDTLRLVRVDGRVTVEPHYLDLQQGLRPREWSGLDGACEAGGQLLAAFDEHRAFHELECVVRDRRGQRRYLVLSGEPLDDHGVFDGFHGTLRDVTARRRAEALTALEHAVTRSLAEADTSRKILQAVMRVICESERWQTAGYFRVEGDDGRTRLIAGWSGPGMSDEAVAYYQSTAGREVPAGGMLSQVIATGGPTWVKDLKEDQTAWAQRVARTGERATLFFPVLVAGRVTGVFAFATREIREPDGPLLQAMRMIGEQVGQFMRRKEAEQVLRESEARFRALTNLSADWYWEVDATLRLQRIEGRDLDHPDALPGRRSIGLTHAQLGLEPEDGAPFDAAIRAGVPFRDLVLRHAKADGRHRFISISGEPILDAKGERLGYRGVGRDISERKEAEIRIAFMATHDALTGLPNRRRFGELLASTLQSDACIDPTTAMLFIDLDGFKRINDSFGHEAGDLVLRETARRLVDRVRPGDVVARLGGDEFVVLLRGVRPDAIDPIARSLVDVVSRPVVLDAVDVSVTASIGISLCGVDAVDGAEMQKHADLAMYRAKQDGKNGFRRFGDDVAPSAMSMR